MENTMDKTDTTVPAGCTPGPWRGSVGTQRHIGDVVTDDGLLLLARIQWSDRGTTYVPDRDAAVSNTRLMAASPDLYRELRHLVRLLEPVEEQLNVPGLATLNGARAALAKAEGR